MTEPVSARNCVGVVPPDTPVASAERMLSEAPATTGRPGEGPYACHSFTLSKQVVAQCSAGFVMNAEGRCVCPEGTTFRNGQCRPDGGEPPPPPPPPPPPVEECKLLPGQIRTEDGRCICPRGTDLSERPLREGRASARAVQAPARPDQARERPLRLPAWHQPHQGSSAARIEVQCKLLPGQITHAGRPLCLPARNPPRQGRVPQGSEVQCKLLPGQIRHAGWPLRLPAWHQPHPGRVPQAAGRMSEGHSPAQRPLHNGRARAMPARHGRHAAELPQAADQPGPAAAAEAASAEQHNQGQ